ncbi:uncharacterized protein LOC141684699 [Apium graveolens]|uniref:uncharacterized protein LOC141684699 n=1 Tax=Apium graveolens TaxID=4045 RepID=UPI003D7A402F
MNNLYYRNLYDHHHLSVHPLEQRVHQFSTSYYQSPTIPPTILSPAVPVPLPVVYDFAEETAIIGGTDDFWTHHSELEERMERVEYSEETAIIGEAYDYWLPNNNQPTYEENLELEEQMGRVGSRLSEETIMGHLKITSYDATNKMMDEEADICVICQGEYEKDDLIGGLQCRHEYHVECIKRWLQQHNSCPICKAEVVSPNA